MLPCGGFTGGDLENVEAQSMDYIRALLLPCLDITKDARTNRLFKT